MACLTSGSEVEPLIAVMVPRQLMRGRMPIWVKRLLLKSPSV